MGLNAGGYWARLLRPFRAGENGLGFDTRAFSAGCHLVGFQPEAWMSVLKKPTGPAELRGLTARRFERAKQAMACYGLPVRRAEGLPRDSPG